MDDRNSGGAGDLSEAADVAGGDDVGLQPLEIGDLAGPQRRGGRGVSSARN